MILWSRTAKVPRQFLDVGDEAVPFAGNRFDETRVGVVVTKRMADLRDGMVNGVGDDRDIGPNGLEEIFSGDGMAPILKQKSQRLECLPSQVNMFLSATETVPLSAKDEVAELEK